MKTSMKQVLEGMVDIPPTTPNPVTKGEQEALINKTKVNDSQGDKKKQDGQPEKKQPGVRWEFTDEVNHFHADKPAADAAPISGLSIQQKRFSVDESKNLTEMLDLGAYHSEKLDKHRKLMKSNKNNPEKENYHKARVSFHAGVLEKLDKVPAGTYANESKIIEEVLKDQPALKPLCESEYWGRKPNPGEVDIPRQPTKTITPAAGQDLHSALSLAHRTGKSLKLHFSDGDHVIIEPTIAREIIAKKARHVINSATTDDLLTQLLCDVMEC